MISRHAFSRKAHEAEARERLRAFWAGGELDRPALHFTVHQPAEDPFTRDGWTDDAAARDRNTAWHVYQARHSIRHTLYLAESMPVASYVYAANVGLVAELAGGRYAYHHGHAWVQPLADVYERPTPRFDPNHPAVRVLTDAVRQMATAIGHEAAINLPAFGLDSLTTLSLFRGPEHLCADLLEIPDTVLSWCATVDQLIVDCYEYFYQLVCSLGYGETSSWLPIMAEGRCEAVQCDFAVMLSPDMFTRFALPSLQTVTEYFDYSLYHLDGTCQTRFLNALQTLPHLNGIQWNPEPGAGSAVDWIHAYRAIRERGFCLLNNNVSTVDEAVAITKALGPDGLMIALPPFQSISEAEDAIRAIERASRESRA